MTTLRSPERLAAHVRMYDLALAMEPTQARSMTFDVCQNLQSFSPPLGTDAVLVSVLLGQYPRAIRDHGLVQMTVADGARWAPVWGQVAELVPDSWSVMPCLMQAVALRAAGHEETAKEMGRTILLDRLHEEDPGDGPCRWRMLGTLLCAYAVGEYGLGTFADLLCGADLQDAYFVISGR